MTAGEPTTQANSDASGESEARAQSDGGKSGTQARTETGAGSGFRRALGDLDAGRLGRALVPIVLLVLVLAVVFAVVPLSDLGRGEAVPEVTVSYHTLPDDETIVLHATNDGPEPVTIQQVLVDEAYWDHQVLQDGQADRTLGPRESARIEIPYHWQPGWDYHVELVLSNGATFGYDIVAAQSTPGVDADLLWTLALIGALVGVIPVILGMLWFPFLQSIHARWLHAVLAFAAGLLAFLALDAGIEAVELVERIPGAYEGHLLIALGAIGALLAVQAIGAWRRGRTDGAVSGLWVAYLVAVGIGLHNLAEGLAIGGSFALGRFSLGSFLILGFALHNVTEGPAVVAPLTRGERPPVKHFLALGVIAGAPVIFGGWLASLVRAPAIGAFFLAVGVGAIVQVDWEIAGLIRDDGGKVGSAMNLIAFLVGFAAMYATDLLIVF